MLSYFQKILSAPTPSRIFVEFFPKPVYHIITWKIFKFNMFKLMENASQTIEFRHFYSCPLEKLFPKLFIMTSLADENYPLAPRQHFFQTLFPSSRKGRKIALIALENNKIKNNKDTSSWVVLVEFQQESGHRWIDALRSNKCSTYF